MAGETITNREKERRESSSPILLANYSPDSTGILDDASDFLSEVLGCSDSSIASFSSGNDSCATNPVEKPVELLEQADPDVGSDLAVKTPTKGCKRTLELITPEPKNVAKDDPEKPVPPKRPRSAYVSFFKTVRDRNLAAARKRQERVMPMQVLIQTAKKEWRELEAEERLTLEQQAAADQVRYQQEVEEHSQLMEEFENESNKKGKQSQMDSNTPSSLEDGCSHENSNKESLDRGHSRAGLVELKIPLHEAENCKPTPLSPEKNDQRNDADEATGQIPACATNKSLSGDKNNLGSPPGQPSFHGQSGPVPSTFPTMHHMGASPTPIFPTCPQFDRAGVTPGHFGMPPRNHFWKNNNPQQYHPRNFPLGPAGPPFPIYPSMVAPPTISRMPASTQSRPSSVNTSFPDAGQPIPPGMEIVLGQPPRRYRVQYHCSTMTAEQAGEFLRRLGSQRSSNATTTGASSPPQNSRCESGEVRFSGLPAQQARFRCPDKSHN